MASSPNSPSSTAAGGGGGNNGTTSSLKKKRKLFKRLFGGGNKKKEGGKGGGGGNASTAGGSKKDQRSVQFATEEEWVASTTSASVSNSNSRYGTNQQQQLLKMKQQQQQQQRQKQTTPTPKTKQSSSAAPSTATAVSSKNSTTLAIHTNNNGTLNNENNNNKNNNNNNNNDDDEEDISKLPTSWLSQTRFFRTMVDQAFEDIDADGSGDIDEKELYSGLLLIHLKLGAYAGPAACRPITRDKCHSVFTKMDVDGSGHLDKEEFAHVMMVLFGNVMMRVMFQYAATLMIVPLLAKTMFDAVFWLMSDDGIPKFINTYIDPLTPVDEIIDNGLLKFQTIIIVPIMDKLIPIIPQQGHAILQQLARGVMNIMDKIPDSVWSTIPLTLLSTILSMMIIPWTLMKIDDYFQSVADKKAQTTTTTTTTTTGAANNNNK